MSQVIETGTAVPRAKVPTVADCTAYRYPSPANVARPSGVAARVALRFEPPATMCHWAT